MLTFIFETDFSRASNDYTAASKQFPAFLLSGKAESSDMYLLAISHNFSSDAGIIRYLQEEVDRSPSEEHILEPYSGKREFRVGTVLECNNDKLLSDFSDLLEKQS